jgi:hypothetical protein
MHPHDTNLKIEDRKRERRDPAIAAQALGMQAQRSFGIAALGAERRQGAEALEARATPGGLLSDGEGFLISAEALKNRRTLATIRRSRWILHEPRLSRTSPAHSVLRP